MKFSEKLALSKVADRKAAIALLTGKRNYPSNLRAQEHLEWARQAYKARKMTLKETIDAIIMKRKALHGRAQSRPLHRGN